MKRVKISVLALLISFLFTTNPLFSQSILQDAEPDTIHGLAKSEWDLVNLRWDKFQPRIEIVTNTGDTLSGQLLSFTSEKITIYYGSEIPFSDIIEGETEDITFDKINTIHFTKGGASSPGLIIGSIVGGGVGLLTGLILTMGYSIIIPVITAGGGATGGAFLGKRAQKPARSTTISMDDDPITIRRQMDKVIKHQVVKEGFKADGDFDHFTKNSSSLKRAFPDKHFRISFGTSVGPNTIKGSLEEMLASTTLAPITEYRKGPMALEIYDISWRFSDRYIAGGQLVANAGEYTYLFNSDYENDNHYNNSIIYIESRIYFEYAPRPVSRTFSKKHELLLGGGIIFSTPYSDFNYSYYPGMGALDDENINKYHSPMLMGLQLRSSFHYYLFPGFSVSAGIEGNLIQSAKIDSYELPTSDPLEFITIPDYKLNFSTVRFKAGASIYF